MKKKNVIKIATDIDFNQGSYYLGSIHFIIFVFLMYEFCFLCSFLKMYGSLYCRLLLFALLKPISIENT